MWNLLKTLAKIFAVLLLVVAGLVAWNWQLAVVVADMAMVAFEEPDWGAIKDEDTLIRFLAAHPDDFGLIIQTIDETGAVVAEPLAHRADEPHALASTVKIVVLSAVARALHDGAWAAEDPLSSEAWDSWYIPATDGGAHAAAYDQLGIPHTDGFANEPHELTVLQVTGAMIRWSDNAATDLLITRLGDRLGAEAALLGHSPIRPLFHDMLAVFWPDETGDYRDDAVRARITAQAAPPTKFSFQRTVLAESMSGGTPRTYARIQAGVATRTWISPEASGFMADLLDWPMDIPGNADQFAQLGTKGGSVPGVLTEATYLVAMEGDHAGEIRVGALFLNRLSGSAWLSLQESFVQQGLLVSMLTDDDTVDRVVRALD